jgi:hypothetical protein
VSPLPVEILEKARMFAQLAEHNSPEMVAQILAPWLREDAESFVQVTLALALMADMDKFLKAGHAAYVRGEKGQAVEDLERQYHRERKARTRAYELQKMRAEMDGEVTTA